MSKKYDIYMKDGTASIYPRGEIAECGDLPDGKPLKVMDEGGDWYDWCMEDCGGRMDDDAVRVCRLRLSIDAAFARDLEKKAQELMDRYIRDGKGDGWGELEIDHSGMNYTYRNSANWKDEPIRYTFDQPLKWTNDCRIDTGNVDHMWTRDLLVRLHGMADAAYELGLTITFDSEFKIHVMGAFAEWQPKYEC